MVKNLPANAGGTRDTVLIPGLGRYPGAGNGNPLQHPCLENSMDRGAWWTTVHTHTQNMIPESDRHSGCDLSIKEVQNESELTHANELGLGMVVFSKGAQVS